MRLAMLLEIPLGPLFVYAAFREVCAAEKEAAAASEPKKAADRASLGTSLGKKICKTATECAEDGRSVSGLVQSWVGQMREQAQGVPNAAVRDAVLAALPE